MGICGLSCKLCPRYHTTAKSRCGGCKSAYRMGAGCPFITCAIKKKGVEFCWLCGEGDTCEKWQKHRRVSQHHDSFKCYQTLETDIRLLMENGVDAFLMDQELRANLLTGMLENFNEGRSKNYYCIVATVFEIEEIEEGLSLATEAIEKHAVASIKEKSKILHAIFDEMAENKNYLLTLRK